MPDERTDPKILDNRVHNLIFSTKDKLQKLTAEINGLKKDAQTLNATIELGNKEKKELVKKEEECKLNLSNIRQENDNLMVVRNELDQKSAKAKEELQGLIKLHNQAIKTYNTKLARVNEKEKQDELKRKEERAIVKNQIAQVKRDKEELKLHIVELTKKIQNIKSILEEAERIEKERVKVYGNEVKELELLISDNNYI